MEQGLMTEILIPASLMLIMLGMGLSLVVEDFARLVREPRAVISGLCAQLIIVPVIGWLVVLLVPTRPVLAVGVLIISFCPGGAVSNLIAHLARGNTALSISLTAISSIISVFTIPVFVNLAISHFLGVETEFRLPVARTAIQLGAITIFPVVVGMAIRRWFGGFASRSERLVKIASAAFLVFVIIAAVYDKVDRLPEYLVRVGGQLLLLNLIVLALGYASARIMGLDARDRVTIAIEAGIQNGALGIAIPATFIGNAEMAIPPAIYGVLMILTASVLIGARTNRQIETV